MTSAPGPSRRLPAAVLWDMDGTLIDSEPYWIAEEHALVASYGGVWTDEHAHALVGNALEVSAQYILDHSPVDLTVLQVVDRLMHGVMGRIEEHVPWRPGAFELLEALRVSEVRLALVTMSWRPFTDLFVGLLPEGAFDIVVPGDAVGHGKPHPEPYLTAAGLLGIRVEDCVAIEDSPSGVRSAVAAGVPTIAVPHIVPVPRLAGSVQIPTLAGLRPEDLLPLLDAAIRHP
ncbi:HAD family hydrolase [Lapillicoccus sp.]|uniref:HAD family hydrolase n=1 Tax=Lapillicoccus sp. TaxID=1909287 RepID=UPI0025F1E754|nr:HAD family hydrolase [Lapillicoccus sp.]